MASVTLTYADGSKETVALLGQVRVEVDSDSPFSRTLHSGGLCKVELSDREPDTLGHGVGEPTVEPEPVPEPESVAEAPVEKPKPAAKKTTAAKKTKGAK